MLPVSYEEGARVHYSIGVAPMHLVEQIRALELPARAGNRRFWCLRALRAHTKAPYENDLPWRALRALNRPARARTERLRLLLRLPPPCWSVAARRGSPPGAACAGIRGRAVIRHSHLLHL
jgi:hypothetical protein